MKQSWIPRGLLLVLPLVALALLWGHSAGWAKRARAHSESPAQSAAPPQQLSPDGQASLRAIIQAGNLSDLRWPDFSDYEKHLQKFYDSYGFSLVWVRGMEPTAQARQLIAVLQDADQKGLSAEDYDGSRWGDRLAKLKPAAPQPSETDAVRFDAALTVCVMRYISDLHIGKVNPKHFDFGFDVESKKLRSARIPENGCGGRSRCRKRARASGTSLSGLQAHDSGSPILFAAGETI